MKLIIFVFTFCFALGADLLAQTCKNSKFISAFVESQLCTDGNNIFSCGSTGAIFNAALAGGIGAGAYGVANLVRSKSKISLTPDAVDSYFKKVSLSSFKNVLIAGDDLSEATIKNLKNKGFDTSAIEKIRTILNEYRQSMSIYQSRLEADLDPKVAQRNQAKAELETLEKKMAISPGQSDHIKQKSELQGRISKLNESIAAIEDHHSVDLRGPGVRAQDQLNQLPKNGKAGISGQSKVAFTLAALAVLGGVAIEAAAPVAVDAAVFATCKGSLDFRDLKDQEHFREFGALHLPRCKAEIGQGSIWQILNMQPKQRNQLFDESPALCRVFEETFLERAQSFLALQATPDLQGTQCGDKLIRAPIRIGNEIYHQTIEIAANKIVLSGAFVSGVEIDSLKASEKFAMSMGPDLRWSGVSTENIVWGGIPGIKENFQSLETAADRDRFENYRDCKPLSGEKKIERQMVNHPSSSKSLMCAAHRQATAMKHVLPQIMAHCGVQNKVSDGKAGPAGAAAATRAIK